MTNDYPELEGTLNLCNDMINKKQTAVEWVVEQLQIIDVDFECELITKEIYFEKREKIIEQALEMESQQHTAIYNEGMKKSNGMMTFLYTEVEGRVDALHNSRHNS